jgi:hypothetical protein
MARISTYPTSVPVGTDLLIGTKDPNSLETKNFSVQGIVDLAAGGAAVTSLSNIGTSGVSTLTAGVLNIPNYTADPSIVKTTGNQTIGGAKIFTTNIAAPNVGGNNTGDQSLSISGSVITISGTNSSVTLPSGGSGAVDSVNGATGTVVLNTGDIAEVTNLYYTEARVSANTNVAANTAKVGITTAQATDITNSVKNDTDTYTSTPPVTKIITLTQAEYTAIVSGGTPNVNTLYIII